MFHQIVSFHEVQWTEENILLLCDIDHTVLHNGKHTDKEGFDQMLLRLKALNGTFLFLTARHWDEEEITKHQLKYIGIPDSLLQNIQFAGHHMTKGEFIRDYLSVEQYARVLFIDDFPEYLESTHILSTPITCYQFVSEKKDN